MLPSKSATAACANISKIVLKESAQILMAIQPWEQGPQLRPDSPVFIQVSVLPWATLLSVLEVANLNLAEVCL